MQQSHTKVLLMAAGMGTRLRPLTDDTPKCLIPIAGRPLLDYWFDLFAAAGLHDILINTHHLPHKVRTYLDRINHLGQFRVQEAYEPTLLGSAGTVHHNRNWIAPNETALIIYADNLSNVDLSSLLSFHHSHNGPMTMLLFRAPYPERCGIAKMDDSARIIEFVEKPKNPRTNLANGGIYALSAAAYHEMADMNRFDLGFDVLPAFVGRMFGWIWQGYHQDIGTIEARDQAERDVRAGRLAASFVGSASADVEGA
ncbi:MAG TPA: nucleotidyltransferase family protein [Tepidisphaeraceae bacterium]|nr:nucleotidyltransferase family protein [Tepidisphaeraceae bacterium]